VAIWKTSCDGSTAAGAPVISSERSVTTVLLLRLSMHVQQL
jgi:hypothetical protein